MNKKLFFMGSLQIFLAVFLMILPGLPETVMLFFPLVILAIFLLSSGIKSIRRSLGEEKTNLNIVKFFELLALILLFLMIGGSAVGFALRDFSLNCSLACGNPGIFSLIIILQGICLIAGFIGYAIQDKKPKIGILIAILAIFLVALPSFLLS